MIKSSCLQVYLLYVIDAHKVYVGQTRRSALTSNNDDKLRTLHSSNAIGSLNFSIKLDGGPSLHDIQILTFYQFRVNIYKKQMAYSIF